MLWKLNESIVESKKISYHNFYKLSPGFLKKKLKVFLINNTFHVEVFLSLHFSFICYYYSVCLNPCCQVLDHTVPTWILILFEKLNEGICEIVFSYSPLSFQRARQMTFQKLRYTQTSMSQRNSTWILILGWWGRSVFISWRKESVTLSIRRTWILETWWCTGIVLRLYIAKL